MKTLIITVGTRQVGWKCKDGVVRSLGADGDRGHPKHIDYLYGEFGLERGYHGEEQKSEFRWGVRHLGELIYQHCAKSQDFSNVELLMDGVILSSAKLEDLDHIILWGTDQPEGTAWTFRRADTLWLAKLMAGKIRQQYPHIKIDVWNPVVLVNQSDVIRQEVEAFILKYALDRLDLKASEPFTLAIETKGSAPQIANALEICAAALMRQCPVEQLIPVEPSPLFDGDMARFATDFKKINLGQYFWPVERSRILSAWERGDFAEAKVWLKAHRDRYEALYELAQHLSLAINWQWQDALKALQGNSWLDHPATRQCIPKSQRNLWRNDIQAQYQVNETASSKFLKLWESRLLIRLDLIRQNYTAAFIQFVQTLERLLFWRYQTEDWIKQRYVILPPDKQNWGVKKYRATFYDLRSGWQKQQDLPNHAPICQQLEAINELRNSVIHRSESLAFEELKKIVCPDRRVDSSDELYSEIEPFLQQFCSPEFPMPERSLIQELYNWGMEQLQATTTA
jgi:hypothetical protein